MGCEVDDPAVLLERAELALDRARRFGDVNLETKALADGGLAHVQAGRVTEGMAMIDEAMALACAGDGGRADSTAKSVCSFFTACYYAGDLGRVEAWRPGSSLREAEAVGVSFHRRPGVAGSPGHANAAVLGVLLLRGPGSRGFRVGARR